MSWEGIPDPMDPWMTHPEVMVLMVKRPTGSCNHEYTVMATAAAIYRLCACAVLLPGLWALGAVLR